MRASPVVPRVLVRRPSPRLASGELTWLERVPVDFALAQEQWDAYVGVFRERGWDVVTVEPADEHPDGVFVEDPLVVFDGLAVLTSPGAPSRRGEVDTVAAAVDDLGLTVERISLPGTLDGGDVLKVGRTVYVGRSARTNEEGIEQLRRLIPDREVVEVPVTRALHLKSAMTALPDGTLIGWSDLIDDSFSGFVAVREPEGAAVVDLGDGTLLMSAAAPRSARLLRERGYEVIPVPIGEYEKLEGCVTCLSVRVRSPL